MKSNDWSVIFAIFILRGKLWPRYNEFVCYGFNDLSADGEILHSTPAFEEYQFDFGQSDLLQEKENIK